MNALAVARTKPAGQLAVAIVIPCWQRRDRVRFAVWLTFLFSAANATFFRGYLKACHVRIPVDPPD